MSYLFDVLYLPGIVSLPKFVICGLYHFCFCHLCISFFGYEISQLSSSFVTCYISLSLCIAFYNPKLVVVKSKQKSFCGK